jgi:hypothetical protein
MPHRATERAEDRTLTSKETELAKWLLEHGGLEAQRYLKQLSDARVVSRCGCGCASVDFAINGRRGSAKQGMRVLSDYQWTDEAGYRFGAFVFSYGDILGGIDVWSIDGRAIPVTLPEVGQLVPVNP